MIQVETPGGSFYRWAEDEPDPANIPSGLRFSSTMPGGFESLEVTLPRKPGVSYSDLERLSTLTVSGPGGEVAWQGRLERAPRVSGDQMAVSPGAVGWQAHLDDDESAREIYVDRELNAWAGASRQRKIDRLTAGDIRVDDPSVDADKTTGIPAVKLVLPDIGGAGDRWRSEAWYDAQDISLGSIYHDYETQVGRPAGDISLTVVLSDDDLATNSISTSDLYGSAGPLSGTGTHTTDDARDYYFGAIIWRNTADITTGSNNERPVFFRRLSVWGNHGLAKSGTAPDDGLLASDVIAHAVGRWAPLLSVDIAQTSFVIPHLVFKEATTAAEIIRQADRFHLYDWAVWEERTFYYHPRGARGRTWRARVAPARLEETGQSVERLWNGIVVRYQDVEGRNRTVGPTGSGAEAESTDLEDSDPDNPATVLGIRRWDLLEVPHVTTQAGATEIGKRFLEETLALSTAGRAQLVGTVTDDRGIERPAWQVRAGDAISFVDASDPSERRIVRTDYDQSSRTCSVDLDAPPEGLQALLERLGAALIPLGR